MFTIYLVDRNNNLANMGQGNQNLKELNLSGLLNMDVTNVFQNNL